MAEVVSEHRGKTSEVFVGILEKISLASDEGERILKMCVCVWDRETLKIYLLKSSRRSRDSMYFVHVTEHEK